MYGVLSTQSLGCLRFGARTKASPLLLGLINLAILFYSVFPALVKKLAKIMAL